MSFSLLIKLAISAACLPALALLVPRDPAAPPAPWRRPAALAILLGVRLVAAGVWAFFPSLVGSPDLALYYVPQGRKLLAGLVPGIDFESSYSPLFTLLTAGALAVLDRPVSVFLLIVAFELGGLWCLDRMLRSDGTAPGLRDAALAAYAVHPLALWYSGVTAYQSTMIMAFFAAALAAFARPWASAALVAFALPFTKLLAVLAWPAPALRRRGTLAALGCFAAALALTAGLAAAGMDPRAALERESLDTSNGNLWFLLGSLAGHPLNRPPLAWLAPVAFVAAVGAALAAAAWRRGTLLPVAGAGDAAAVFSLVGCLFMALSKKSLPMYFTMFLAVLIVVVVQGTRVRGDLVRLALLGCSSLVTPQLWHGKLGQPDWLPVGQALAEGNAWGLLVLALDALTLGLTLYFARHCWLRLARGGPVPAAAATS
jgi:hypothetical protein